MHRMKSLDQHQAPLWQALQEMAQRSQAAFYTPGHRRGRGLPGPFLAELGGAVGPLDLPELPGLDDLFAPRSVIKSAQYLAAQAFGAEKTWFLVNGSTAGVIAAILATCGPGDLIIVPRNSHASVISGLILAGAKPVFVQPEYDPRLGIVYGLAPGAIATALAAFPAAKAILVVYPTYEGVCGDLGAIATLAHDHGIPLLVDEAHGPHFHFHPDLPISALAAGADLVVQSTHKILGSLTQSAMLHTQGNRIEQQRVSQALQMVQSTSPNYLLLASLDLARQQMALGGQEMITQVMALADHARSQLQAVSGMEMLSLNQGQAPGGFLALDPTRITLLPQPWREMALRSINA